MSHINVAAFRDEYKPLAEILDEYYSYCYLESIHHFYKENHLPNVIITGLSYGLDGINTSQLDFLAYNFSLHSQDLYYDVKNVERALEHNASKVTDCIFTFGYYSLFYDLSKTGTKSNCLYVYYPLFHDMHNCELEIPKEVKDNVDEAVKIPKLVTLYHDFFESTGRSYYGPSYHKADTVPDITKKGGWQNLTEEEKIKNAEFLTFHHNRHINYTWTYEENLQLLRKTFERLDDNGTRIHVMVMPFSSYYNERINPKYKENIFSTMDQMEQKINFIDFNDYNLFDEEDFLNPDHLNETGARKLTSIVNEILKT